MDKKIEGKDTLHDIAKVINEYQSFAIFCHISPDGDAIGSAVALRDAINLMGKTAYAFCDGAIPDDLSFLNVHLDDDESKISDVDVMIMVDCNSLERIGRFAPLFDNAKIRCKIDHHQMSEYALDYSYTDTTSPSTCDIIFDLIKILGVDITTSMAQCLYAGISSDTGCFMHESTSAMSHFRSYELMQKGFDCAKANYYLFKYKDRDFLEFLKYFMRKTYTYLGGKLYLSYVDNKHYKKYEKVIETCFFDFLDGVEGNEIRARIFEVGKGVFECELRSNNYVNVSLLAHKFGGGGHIRAAGFTTRDSKKHLIKSLITACQQELDNCK